MTRFWWTISEGIVEALSMNILRAEEAAIRRSLDELRSDCKHHSPRGECAIPRKSTTAVWVNRRRRVSSPTVLVLTEFSRGNKATKVFRSSELPVIWRTVSELRKSRSQSLHKLDGLS